MTEGRFRKAVESGAQFANAGLANAGLEPARVKQRVGQAVDDGMTAARRAAKRGRYAAEDLIDDAAHRVKQDPLRTVAITFWIGFGLGALAVWLVSHDNKA